MCNVHIEMGYVFRCNCSTDPIIHPYQVYISSQLHITNERLCPDATRLYCTSKHMLHIWQHLPCILIQTVDLIVPSWGWLIAMITSKLGSKCIDLYPWNRLLENHYSWGQRLDTPNLDPHMYLIICIRTVTLSPRLLDHNSQLIQSPSYRWCQFSGVGWEQSTIQIWTVYEFLHLWFLYIFFSSKSS